MENLHQNIDKLISIVNLINNKYKIYCSFELNYTKTDFNDISIKYCFYMSDIKDINLKLGWLTNIKDNVSTIQFESPEDIINKLIELNLITKEEIVQSNELINDNQ